MVAHAAKIRTQYNTYPSISSFQKEARIGECWRSLAAAWGSIPSNEGTLRHDSISENGRAQHFGVLARSRPCSKQRHAARLKDENGPSCLISIPSVCRHGVLDRTAQARKHCFDATVAMPSPWAMASNMPLSHFPTVLPLLSIFPHSPNFPVLPAQRTSPRSRWLGQASLSRRQRRSRVCQAGPCLSGSGARPSL